MLVALDLAIEEAKISRVTNLHSTSSDKAIADLTDLGFI